ncbi:hypothetical protein DRQ27_00515 [bacterium]|nr:MAG: hypothetical protein DRQ27_00515 [bacterium]
MFLARSWQYEIFKRIQEEDNVRPDIRIVNIGILNDSISTYIKNNYKVYVFLACHIDNLFLKDSLYSLGIFQIYSPKKIDVDEKAYEILSKVDWSFTNDPELIFDIKSISSGLINKLFSLEVTHPELADSLFQKVKPWIKNLPFVLFGYIGYGLNEELTEINGLPIDSLIDLIEKWCDRFPDDGHSKIIKDFIPKWRKQLREIKAKKGEESVP